MPLFQPVLLVATLLCSLVAGFLFAFASVAMPGLGTLSHREFIRAFQVIDRVIQNNQPLFMLIWVGSIITLVLAGLLGFQQLQGIDRGLLLAAVAIYLFGVQLPTIAVNVPLNNQLQTIDASALKEPALAEARRDFEPSWNRWNVFRTILATLASSILLFLVFRL